jgi:hypothetical protein
MEISVESLLNMTPQQLADASTQSLRAKQINSALQESQIKQSVQDTLEARCRVALGMKHVVLILIILSMVAS